MGRAVEWCESLLKLPPQAMAITRRRTRADLAGLFDESLDLELDDVIENWWSDEGQSVLHALAAKLAKKRNG